MDSGGSGDENSDGGLQIVIDSPSPKPKKKNKKELSESDREIIACVEKDLEENLEEKAAKANLTTKHVKNIIKHVVTNEHVLALVRHAENPSENNEPITVYEPKYTRAKTKQLLSSNSQPILPWQSPPKSPSEVHVLFSEDLQEDSSGDEYVPESSVLSESQLDTSQLDKSREEEEANIALRTRSKLSLNHTPLEVIEGAFMPPDITTDMYDMNCDDDVWKEFLKTFTRPLDEVTKAAEDEDHDPEYNILADEEIDEVDKEELRADRAVTVSRKEFNCLMAELFEFADIYESNKLNGKIVSDDGNSLSAENFEQNEQNTVESDSEDDPNISIKKCQIPLLAQQMRQHVQMLAQNYLLSYEHPEFGDMASKFKELLLSLKAGSAEKTVSIFHIVNLEPALKLINDWEKLFASKNKEVVEAKQYVEKVITESKQAKLAGTSYIVTFPSLLMDTIVNSEVFIYPNLLPRIPFKSSILKSPYYYFSHSEENLIALFLEQAMPTLKQDPFHATKFKAVNMEHVCSYISRYVMPSVNPKKIFNHIVRRKSPNSDENPIKYYYRNKKAPPTVHYVVPLEGYQILPPCKRSPDSLPYQWREYLDPKQKDKSKECDNINNKNDNNKQVILVSTPLKLLPISTLDGFSNYNINFHKKNTIKRKVLPKGPIPPLVTCTRRKKQNVKKLNTVEKVTVDKINTKMLPDMPSLGGTPVKNQVTKQNLETQNVTKSDSSLNAKKDQDLSFANFSFQFHKTDTNKEVRNSFEGICDFSAGSANKEEKDNPDDIHELMIASSTVKNVTKKEPSGAEKKRAKVRREFIANLAMATPDDIEKEVQKEENFADQFYDKMKQTLSSEDYDKLIEILAHYDEHTGEFIDLYQKVQSVLNPKYKELADEFLLFLTDIQAHKVGQLMPYFVMKDMNRFMKKLHVYFKDQPSHLRKLLKCMTDLSENPDVTIDTVKSTILPLFKGNVALTEWFLQLFPYEKPPSILSNGPHEVVDITKELARPPNEDIYETVVLPDTEDPYGGPACICHCHNDESPQFNTRLQHCVKCGLKFIQGKIYIQTGKALRPAVVSFLTNPEKDHTKRLSATQRKRSDTSPSKQVTSPSKEHHTHEETRNSNESEEECEGGKKKRLSKSRRKRKIKLQDKPNATKDPGKGSAKKNSQKTGDKVKTDGAKASKGAPKKPSKRKTNAVKKTTEYKPGSTSGQQKRPAEPEIEYSGPPELVELKVSSDHSGESESEFFESSQDVTNTESDESNASVPSDTVQQNSTSAASWTREEDKIILQAFQQRNDNEQTFKHISEVLRNRSVVEIKNRFHKLMSLLQQMASNSAS